MILCAFKISLKLGINDDRSLCDWRNPLVDRISSKLVAQPALVYLSGIEGTTA